MFLCLGWTPIIFFDSMPYMRAPEGWTGTPELFIPVPTPEPLLDFAYEVAQKGEPWSGMAWQWPASFQPAQVKRVWQDKSLALWDGEDEHGQAIGGSTLVPAGWEDRSTLATFWVGQGPWSATVTWRPHPTVSEHLDAVDSE
jgi:hypothetical protein